MRVYHTGTKEDCSSKLVGELCTVSCVSGDSNSVYLPKIFLSESNESLLHIFGPENLTCVPDVCSYVPNLDNSVVSDRGDTQLRTAVLDTEQTFSCQPNGAVSGTQPVCEPLPCSAPKVDSEYGVDVYIHSADERSCMVSCANDSWTDGGLTMCEPHVCADLSLGSTVAADCDGTLFSHTWTVSCASGYVGSDMDDAVFKCLASPGLPDGTLPSCVLLVCLGKEFDSLEGITYNCDGVGLGDNCGAECAHGVAETYPCVWNDSTSLKINNPPLACSSECSLASVPPAGASHDCGGLALQEELTATCAESYEAKSIATALTAQVCHFAGYTYADTGFQFPSCVTTTLSCSDSTIAQTEKFDALDWTNSTVGGTCIVGCATGYELASGDSLRALTCVSESESVACPTGSLPACQVTRGSISTNHVPIGVNVTYGASCQVVCQRTSFPRTRGRAAQSYFPTGRWRGRKAQCGWQTRSRLHKPTSDSSVSAPDCWLHGQRQHCDLQP